MSLRCSLSWCLRTDEVELFHQRVRTDDHGCIRHNQHRTCHTRSVQHAGRIPGDLRNLFNVLKKCQNKFDCLVNEMLLTEQWASFELCRNKRTESRFRGIISILRCRKQRKMQIILLKFDSVLLLLQNSKLAYYDNCLTCAN